VDRLVKGITIRKMHMKRQQWYYKLIVSFLLTSALFGCARKQALMARGPEWIAPEVAYRHVKEGKAVLVCTYYDERTCRRLHIDNAISLPELEWNIRHGYLSPQKEIIFYCA
jgi:hypothetical protein